MLWMSQLRQPCISAWHLTYASSTTGQQFIGVDGRPVQLKGINWFGFEVR